MKSFLIDLAGAIFDNLKLVYHFLAGLVVVSAVLYSIVWALDCITGN